MVPYLVFSLICFLYWCFIESRFRPNQSGDLFTGWLGVMDLRWQQFFNIFTAVSLKGSFVYNIVLWFRPCWFIAVVGYLALKKWFGKYCIVGVTALSILAFCFSGVRLPWCTEIAFVAMPFVIGGESVYGYLKRQNVAVGGAFY